MPQTEAFKIAYNKLNPAQREAVDAIEGPVMVVAGPGTGKTQILALRIANILLQTDTKPGQILALTFTESGVASMRRRLLEIIGSSAYQVVISTFHGFCNEVIGRYPEYFPRIIGASAITEIDQVKVIKQIIDELALKELKPYVNPYFYIKPLLSAINSLKREGISPAKFAELVEKEESRLAARTDKHHLKGAHKGKPKVEYLNAEKRCRKNKELAQIYHAYQARLTALGFYDFSDMIMEVVEALGRAEDLKRELQETHQYFLVDEHQDTNRAQNIVLELLGDYHEEPNIFVVGDEKQAIFRFQGASLENFIYFKNKYLSAKLIVLEDNYRSSQMILDLSHSLIAGEKRLRGQAGHPEEKVSVYALSTVEAEAYFVAKAVQAEIESRVAPHEIAVLFRDNRDALSLTPVFEKMGIPFTLESDQDILDDIDIKKLLTILAAVNDFGNDELLAAALHVDFFRIPPLEIYRLTRQASDERRSLLEAASTLPAGTVATAIAKLSHYVTAAQNMNLTQFLELVIRDSGFLGSVLARPDGALKLDKLNALFDSVQAILERDHGASLAQFFDYLKVLKEHELLIKTSIGQSLTGRVRLMTAHRSKGLEFESVYIVQAADGHWGNKHRAELLPLPPEVYSLAGAGESAADGGTQADERRLFYVALTRAKKRVAISYAKTKIDGREQLPSQFLAEIDQALIDYGEVATVEKSFAVDRQLFYAPSIVTGGSLEDKELVKVLFEKNGLSVTALNNYLNCPWRYFYSNLVRIPQAKVKHQMYGTAIHGALKEFADACAVTETDKNFLLAKFEEYLNKEPLSEKEAAETLEKGQAALSGYFDKYASTWHRSVLTEFNVPNIELDGGIRLTGKIDKIELLDDSGKVNVVDYKTGKQKTRNEIEGGTKNSNGDIKRQLVFYNLLLNKLAEGGGARYEMISGEIDFIEPDERGQYKKERFEVSLDEIKQLEELIKQTADEILNLAFWDKGCGEKDCEYCALRALM